MLRIILYISAIIGIAAAANAQVPVGPVGLGENSSSGSSAANNLSTWWIACRLTGAQPTTQSAVEASLASCTIPPGILGTSGCIKVYTRWRPTTQNGSAFLRYGTAAGVSGTAIYSSGLIAGTDYQDTRFICNNNSASLQNVYGGPVPGLSSSNSPIAPARNSAVTTFVNFDGSVTAGGTMTLEQYIVSVQMSAGN